MVCIRCGSLGSTQDERPQPPPGGAARASTGDARAVHHVIPLCDLIFLGNPPIERSYLVNADWLRIESDSPIAIKIDGAPIGNVENGVWADSDSTRYEDAIPWTRSTETASHGGFVLTVERPVKVVTLAAPPLIDNAEVFVKRHPGNVHIWAGSANASIGPGPWKHATASIVLEPPGPGPFLVFGPWRFHSQNLVGFGVPARAGTPGGQLIIPPEIEITGIWLLTGTVPPFLLGTRLFYVDEVGFETDWWCGPLQYVLSQPIFPARIDTPIRVPTWAVDQRAAQPLPGWYIEIMMSGAHQWVDLACYVNWRYR